MAPGRRVAMSRRDAHHTYTHIYTYIYMCTYVYIYICTTHIYSHITMAPGRRVPMSLRDAHRPRFVMYAVLMRSAACNTAVSGGNAAAPTRVTYINLYVLVCMNIYIYSYTCMNIYTLCTSYICHVCSLNGTSRV